MACSGGSISEAITVSCNLTLDEKSVVFNITEDGVSWHYKDQINKIQLLLFLSKTPEKAIPYYQVMQCLLSKSKSAVGLYYIEENKKGQYAQKEMIFQGSKYECIKCAQCLQTNLKIKTPQRPKNVLLYVNPVSGFHRGETILHACVVPVLDMMNIKHKVVVTERQGHIYDDLQTVDLKEFDGIVIIGGDGTFGEACRGLVKRIAADSSVNIDEPGNLSISIPIRLAIIPAGTGQGIASYASSLTPPDVETAVLLLATGYSKPVGLLGVYCKQKLVYVSTLLVCYGLFAELIKYSEANRWLPGALRYIAGAVKSLASHKTSNVRLSYLPVSSINETGDSGESATDLASEWQSLEASVRAVNCFVFDLVNSSDGLSSFDPRGMSVYIVGEKVTRLNHLQFFADMNPMAKSSTHSNVQQLKVKAVRVDIQAPAVTDQLDVTHIVDVDGEALELDEPSFEVWMWGQASLHMFAKPTA